jgi:hypothetical protein
MFATVLYPAKKALPSIYGPYYSLDSALQAVRPNMNDEAIVYDIDRPVADLFAIAGRIFPSGRTFIREEYRLEMSQHGSG